MAELSPTDKVFNAFVSDFIGSKLDKLPYVAEEASKHETEYLRDIEFEVLDGLGRIRVKQNYFVLNGLFRIFNKREPRPRLRAFVDHLDPEVPHMNFGLTDLDDVTVYRRWDDGSGSFEDATQTDKQLFLEYFGVEVENEA